MTARPHFERARLHGYETACGEIANEVAGLHHFGARAVERAESAIRHPHDDLGFADARAGRITARAKTKQTKKG